MIGILVEAAGWTGMVLLLLSYFLLSTRRLESQSLTYQWMNIIGAVALASAKAERRDVQIMLRRVSRSETVPKSSVPISPDNPKFKAKAVFAATGSRE